MHSDGGSHFDNQVVKKLAKVRGWKHTICTPYAKWAHGVAEHNNKEVLKILRPLCRQLDVEVNKWPTVIKLVQSAMNRQRRQSRGGMSPIELTTGIKPMTAAAMLYQDGVMVEQLDEAATLTLRETVRQMARHMEGLYDAANLARRAKSEANRKNTAKEAIPNINVGDFVLYAKHKTDTKLDYTWVGPAVVTEVVSPLILTIRPYTLYDRQSFDVHISRVRRFAGKDLHVTEELRRDIEKDHPDNVVGKVVNHSVENGTLFLRVRWKGFTAEMDTWQEGKVMFEDAPGHVADYLKARTTNMDEDLAAYKAQYFPSLDAEEQTEQMRQAPGAVAPGRRKTVRRRGRTLAQVEASAHAEEGSVSNKKTNDKRGRVDARVSGDGKGSDDQSHTEARTQRWKRRAQVADSEIESARMATFTEKVAAIAASRSKVTESTEICGWTGPTEEDGRLVAMMGSEARDVLRAVAAAHWKVGMSSMYGKYDFTMAMARLLLVDQCAGGGEPTTTAMDEDEAHRGVVEVTVADTAVKDNVGAGDDDSAVVSRGEKDGVGARDDESAVASGGEEDDAGEINSCGVEPSTWREKARPMFTLKTEVRPSSIPGAGMGLWLVEDAMKDERLAIYTGEVIDAAEAASRTSAYMWKVNKKTFVDAEKDFSRKGRYVNDGGKSGRANNARMSRKRSLNVCKKTGVRWTGIVASKNIKAPAEIFMSYGKAYVWPEKKVAPMMMACSHGYMECGKKDVDGGAGDGAGGAAKEEDDVTTGGGGTVTSGARAGGGVVAKEEVGVTTGGGGTVTSGARAGGGVDVKEEDDVTTGGGGTVTSGARAGGGVAAKEEGDVALAADDVTTDGGDAMVDGVTIGGGVVTETGSANPGGGVAATLAGDVTTDGGEVMTDGMPTGGGIAMATEDVAPGGGVTSEGMSDMAVDGNRAGEVAAKYDEETADEGAGDEQRVEDGIVLSWLEQVGKHVVGAGVVRVVPRLMRAMKAFIRAWSGEEEDEMEP
jgi:hypothetical protein